MIALSLRKSYIYFHDIYSRKKRCHKECGAQRLGPTPCQVPPLILQHEVSQPSIPVNSRLAEWSPYVICILAAVIPCQGVSIRLFFRHKRWRLTWRLVIANSKILWNTWPNIRKTARAGISGTSNPRGALPDNLAEVAPRTEVAIGRLSLSIEAVESGGLAVVEQVRNDVGDIGLLDSCCDVLTIAATVNGHVVGENARFGYSFGRVGEVQIPCHVRGRVVGTMEVVLIDDDVLVSRNTLFKRCRECHGQKPQEGRY